MAKLTDKQIQEMINYNQNRYGAKKGVGKGEGMAGGGRRNRNTGGCSQSGPGFGRGGGRGGGRNRQG